MSEDTPPSETASSPLEGRRRVEYAPIQMPFTGGQGRTWLFGAIVAACGGAAAYMVVGQRMPWTDMRVIAPAVGALWFGLRLFMTLTPKS